MKRFHTRGFTLIELLVVIAIIAILASIIIASLNTERIKSRDARRVADLKTLQTALELYSSDNAAYPILTTAAQITTTQLSSTYISAIPVDPSGGTSYPRYWSNGATYVLETVYEGA